VDVNADGYEYQPGEDNCYIVLVDDVAKPTQVDGSFESFMKLAAEEGVSVEVAMKLYNSFKQ
jgi:23S rRNA C2498 (ribose-2'-O)-methylase RlmM